MKNDSKTPHMGMIVALGVLIAAIWMLAIYDTIQDAHEEKYDVSVRPGAVSYGTHSSATVPMVSAPTRHTAAPMISGSAVRSYAHYGHASMPSSAVGSGFMMHTTSSATVHTVGSGGGASGGGSSASGGKGGSRGIAYGGGSASMPSLALATPTYAATYTNEGAARNGGGPRKVHDVGGGEMEGDYNGEYYDGYNQYWDAINEEWVDDLFDGALKFEGGNTYVYDHTAPGDHWVLQPGSGDPGVPLGDAPWLWMLLLALGYAIAKIIRTKHNTI